MEVTSSPGTSGEGTSAVPHTKPRLDWLKKSWRVVFSMLFFLVLSVAVMGGHLGFSKRIDKKPVKEELNQGLQTAVANLFAVFVAMFLVGSLSIAYNQILWRLLSTRVGEKAFPARVIDKLVPLPGRPWGLLRWRILSRGRHLISVWIVALLCTIMAFALSFPPGAVTTEFHNQDDQTLRGVRTMNISDYGDGTIQQFVEHSLFEVNGDLNYNQAWVRPKLKAMAAQVLASGEPVRFDSPCGSSCLYNISLDGPTFRCEEPETKPRECGEIYEAEDLTLPGPDERYSLVNNAFTITWDPNPKLSDCDLKSRRSLVCRMELATYTLEIENSLDASRSIKTKIHNQRDVWTNESWVQSQFYYYFYNSSGSASGNGRYPEPIMLDELHTNFTNSQAFAIRQAAVNALEGEVEFTGDGDNAWRFAGNGSLVQGSPYIGLSDKYNPQFNISAESIERFLQDVVISTLSLGASTHNADIQALVGTEVYLFNEQKQFFAGYGSCLLAAVLINIYAIICLAKNGSPAGNDFHQFAATPGSSEESSKSV